MDLVQLIYTSQPFGYDAATLSGVLLDARRCNERDGVTGALVCRHDIFLQLLEGPGDVVHGAFDRICRDDRHVDITTRVSGPVPVRLFENWAMLHDPARSWIWTREEISGGILDRATEAEFRALFADLAGKVSTAPPD